MKTYKQRGGVSLFIVIFTTLIVTIIAVSFTQAMVRNQQQATASDLSQRAYNSALAGVEDAKRVLIAQQKACANEATQARCNELKSIVDRNACDTIYQAGVENASAKETTVGDPSDNQAYTCVKIKTKTSLYNGNLTKDESKVIHLRSSKSFNKIRLHWFTREDAANNTPTIKSLSDNGKIELPTAANWSNTTPPIMRAQFIPGAVSTAELDSKAKTLFLYPLSQTGAFTYTTEFSIDNRAENKGVGKPVPTPGCVAESTSPSGMCSVTIDLPDGDTQSAYLQLAAIYNSTHFTVELLNGLNVVDFDGVQPVVDSTGRADNLFRRVKASVELNPVSLPYPDAELYVKNSICKDFSLKNEYVAYDPGDCDPAN